MSNPFIKAFLYKNAAQTHESESVDTIKDTLRIYRTIYDVAGVALLVIDEDLTILYANHEMERLSGVKREQLEGKEKVVRFIHPNHQQRMLGFHAQRRNGKGNPPSHYNFTFVDIFGQEKDVIIKVCLVPETKISVAALTDLTETGALEKRLLESEEKYRQLFENAQEGIYQSDYEGRLMIANTAFAKMLGYTTVEEVLEVNLNEIYTNLEKRAELISNLLENGTIQNVEIEWRNKNGTTIYVRASARLVNSFEKTYYETTVVDITNLKIAQREMEASRQYFKNIINSLPDPTFAVDTEGSVVAWNTAMEQLTGVPAHKMLGCGNYEYSLPLYGERRPILIDFARNPEIFTAEQYSYIRREGDTVIAEAYAPLLRNGRGAYLWGSAAMIYDINRQAVGAINTIKDFTEYKQTEEKLKYFSMHDILTGLYNRSYFEEELRRLDDHHHTPVSVIMFDVDGLKLINDSMGHHKGDELLKAAAAVIGSVFRSSDAVSRIGGDEFAVILPKTTSDAAEDAVTRTEQAIINYNESNPHLPLSLSIGFATGCSALKDIVVEADNNLNRSKLHRSRSAKSNFTTTLMAMLAERDFITEGHAERLEGMARVMADAVGLASFEKSCLILLAKFHDIGKVGIPDNILFKPGSLTKIEMDEMKRHSEIGFRIAQSSPELSHIAKYILHHHEWWNGTGYPLGLRGEEIPLLCRILSILDTYDAMTSDRPYRKALSCQEVMSHIKSVRGIQFDPFLADLFLDLLRSQNCFGIERIA